MFKICKLIMYSMDAKSFTYNFESGINYFRGENSSGKTEFYNFIDFMFGSSENIMKKHWYVDSLKKATMVFEIEDIEYCITRTREPNENYLYYSGENEGDAIDLREYKNRLNSIFTRDIELLKDIRNFTDEELTYRSFTMFNFLGEKRQGATYDFLDKCSNVKYSVKLAPILNFIFNKNLEKIYKLQKELKVTLDELKELEINSARYDFILNQVNHNLEKLGGNIWYTGKNSDDILKNLITIKDMKNTVKKKKEKNIADLEVMFNNISEQIKVYENSISDTKQFEKDNQNRKLLLGKLDKLIDKNADFGYLVEPLKNILTKIENTIAFSDYVINDNTVKELKKQQKILRTEIQRNDSRFKIYTLDDKSKSIALIEDYLSTDVSSNEFEIKEKRKRIRELREEIKALQASDDDGKIRELSEYITNLYYSAKEISSVVEDDMNQEGFKIQYFKRGNILQPMVAKVLETGNDMDKKKDVNYYIGSMARHTLIQLCGYLAFLNILLKDNRYPLIPILVIDHISKPFDEKNKKSIGKVISTAFESIGKENLQIFMFDNEEYDALAIQPDHFENLVHNLKTGFNPFFISYSNEEEEEEDEDEKKQGKEDL